MEPRALRRYAIALLLLLATGLGAGELIAREAASDWDKLTGSQKLVFKVLAADTRDVIAGDSHVGIGDKYAAYAFLGRGGITPWELERVVKTFFRNRPIGRVMIESGPQMVAKNRQVEWRSLARYSLVRQVFPFSVFVFEPELINALETRLAPRPGQNASARDRDEAMTVGNEQDIPSLYSRFSPEERLERTTQRVSVQRPTGRFANGIAWQAQEGLLRWLVENGGSVCMVRVPVSPDWERQAAIAGNKQRFERHLNASHVLASRLGIRYVDYRDLGFGELPLGYFRDTDHIVTKGHAIYWPAVEDACFSPSPRHPMTGQYGLLLYKLDLVNPGFESVSRDATMPSGWAVSADSFQLGDSEQAYRDGASQSQLSFGVEPNAANPAVPSWTIGKRFRVGKVSRILLRMMILPRAAELPAGLPTLAAGEDVFADNDAYFRIVFRDAAGAIIPLTAEAGYSLTASHQRLNMDEYERLKSDWWTLSHAVDVPSDASSFEFTLVATGGARTPAHAGHRANGANILIDEFDLLADGPLEELAANSE